MAPLVVRKDVDSGTLYASRNYNDLSESIRRQGHTREELDWQLQLRLKPDDTFSPHHEASAPPPQRLYPDITEYRSKVKQEGSYHQEKFGNIGETSHYLVAPSRFAEKETVYWQTHLRGSTERTKSLPAPEWNPYHTRSRSSFDRHIRSNMCVVSDRQGGAPHPASSAALTTPFEPVSSYTAIPCERVRSDSAYLPLRQPGCEGASASQWSCLLPGVTRWDRPPHGRARKDGENRKLRDALGWETTLRGFSDNRSNEGLVAILGKKQWYGSQGEGDPLQMTDPKLRHKVQVTHILPGPADAQQVAKRSNRNPVIHRRKSHLSPAELLHVFGDKPEDNKDEQ